MAGVEQATAPGAATPEETPDPAGSPGKREPKPGRRRASHQSGRASDRQPDAEQPHPKPPYPAHARRDDDDNAAAPADSTHEAEPDKTGANAGETTGVKPHTHQGPDSSTDPAGAHQAATEPTTKAGAHQAGTESSDTTDTPDAEPSKSGRAVRAAGTSTPTTPSYRPRHAKNRRRRWPVLVAAGVVLAALAGAGGAALIDRQNDDLDEITAPAATNIAPAPANLPTGMASVSPSAVAAPPPAAAAAPGTADCRWNVMPDKKPRVVPPARATRSGLVRVTVGTNRGPIVMDLDATNAPCTVESFLTLASNGYFTDTACHRLTTMLIFVLQCGDPTATGSGDPGYSFNDENLPAPGGTPYPRGTLAMANAGPDTNGSQFFVVYKDSAIDPNYPVFGKIISGLELVDQVAAGGAPGNDGQPNLSLVIQAVQVS